MSGDSSTAPMDYRGLENDAIIDAFETCTLPKAAFDHALHVRVAWIYLQDLPVLRALDHFSTGLKRYARSVGADGLYHETITWAYMFAIRERMADCPTGDWDEFAGANPELFARRPSLLDGWYRTETLQSDLARRIFVMPDR